MSGELHPVRLLRYPVALSQESSAHADALMREFTLIGTGDSVTVPDRLVALIDDLRSRYVGVGDAQRQEVQRAHARGLAEIDLSYEVPSTVAVDVERLVSLLEEADEFCRAGKHLVTLAASAENVVFRRWFALEFQRQLEGHPPIPWPEFDADLPVGGTVDVSTDDELALPATAWEVERGNGRVTIALTGDLDLATAPPLRDLLAALRSQRVGTIVLDSAAVGFVDSVGLSVLVACHLRCEEEGSRLVLRAPSDRMLGTVRVAALDAILHIET